MQVNVWPRVAVVGAGAVGCYFGGMLARAGAPVTLVGRAPHVEAINGEGLVIESTDLRETIRVAASTEISAARDAAIWLLCVKTLDTEEAARAIAPYLSSRSILVSLQNGVDNVERIYSATGIKALPAVVYVAAQMIAPGVVKHTARGDLVIGDLRSPTPDDADHHRVLRDTATVFNRADVQCLVSENISADLWTKLIINCAFNAISALGRARYGRIVNNPFASGIVRTVIEESVAVATAAGVTFGGVDLVEAGFKLGAVMHLATSSTAQDIERGKLTEIDSLNGYIVRRGEELGVSTPVNKTLHALIKLLEEAS
jgi:2-dehydropantoate 2-reductase